MVMSDLDPGAQRLWPLIREQIAGTNGAEQDERRLKSVLAKRRSKSEEFFASASGQWDHLRSELFGDRFHLHAMLSLIDPALTVGDLGCGTGQVSELVAPHVAKVIAVDGSTDMVQAARKRLKGLHQVEVRRGDMEALPIDDGTLDVAVVALVLHHVPEPARALAEMNRVLKCGGRVADRRHAAARSRRVPAADGARLAGVFGKDDQETAGDGRLRSGEHRQFAGRRSRPRARVVCGDGTQES